MEPVGLARGTVLGMVTKDARRTAWREACRNRPELGPLQEGVFFEPLRALLARLERLDPPRKCTLVAAVTGSVPTQQVLYEAGLSRAIHGHSCSGAIGDAVHRFYECSGTEEQRRGCGIPGPFSARARGAGPQGHMLFCRAMAPSPATGLLPPCLEPDFCSRAEPEGGSHRARGGGLHRRIIAARSSRDHAKGRLGLHSLPCQR